MAGFVHTLTSGEITVVGPITFTEITNLGNTVNTGLTEWLFPTNKISQVQVIDASNCDGSFCIRITYHLTDQVEVPLIDVVGPSAGEVLKSFAIEAPLLEILGDGEKSLFAEALDLGGAEGNRANLVIVAVERDA